MALLDSQELENIDQQLTLLLNSAPETLFNATSAQELSRVDCSLATGRSFWTPTPLRFSLAKVFLDIFSGVTYPSP